MLRKKNFIFRYLRLNLTRSTGRWTGARPLGFSDKELSLLLGYHAVHVRDVENPPDTPRYPPKDTNYLLQILDCSLKQIMAGKLTEKYYQLITEKKYNEGHTVYEIHLDKGDLKSIPYRNVPTADQPTVIKSTNQVIDEQLNTPP